MFSELKRMLRYLDADDGADGGGGEPEPEPQPEPEPEPAEDLDAAIEAGKQQYRQRLQELGGKFDAEGNFQGFADVGSVDAQPLTNDDGDDDDVDTKIGRVEAKIITGMKPQLIDGGISRALQAHPELKRYEREARAAIDKMPAGNINDQTILSTLYFMRGQGADMEVLEARSTERKKATGEATKIDAGAAASTSQGGNNAGGGSTVKVDALVADLAEGWGIDPAKMQAAYNEKKGKTN